MKGYEYFRKAPYMIDLLMIDENNQANKNPFDCEALTVHFE